MHNPADDWSDTLVHLLPKADERWPALRERVGDRYALATFHRVSNVDKPETLREIMTALARIAERIPVVFPVHPRTAGALDRLGLCGGSDGLRLMEPLGYLDFLQLMAHARLMITDSGGIQEETTILQVPCLTVRETTERPITVASGWNRLVGTNPDVLVAASREVLAGDARPGRRPLPAAPPGMPP